MNADEVYCSSCGESIKAKAEICPYCGVRQLQNTSNQSNISDMKLYELQKVANKDATLAIILGIFITPLSYIYVDKWGYALINFFTLNYFFLGFIIVPFHTYSMISNARKELDYIGGN